MIESRFFITKKKEKECYYDFTDLRNVCTHLSTKILKFVDWLKVAFIHKVLIRSSNLQTDKPNHFPELEILKLTY